MIFNSALMLATELYEEFLFGTHPAGFFLINCARHKPHMVDYIIEEASVDSPYYTPQRMSLQLYTLY